MRTGPLYTLGRACAVVTRPLCLFTANNWLSPATAGAIAIVFLLSQLSLVALAADPHRRFYAQYFSGQHPVNGLTFYLYACSVGVLALCGLSAVFGGTLYFTQDVLLGAVSGGYFVSEKLMDELLRVRLFEREFSDWGRMSTLRTLFQLTGLIVLLALFGRSLPAWVAIAALLLGNLLASVRYIPAGLGRAIRTHGFRTFAWLTQRAVRSMVGNWMLWVVTLLSAAVAYLDRMVALVLERDLLPLFMLVVMCFSVLQMAMDFYYVSRYRRDFLEHRISIAAALASRAFGLSLGIGALIAIAGTIFVMATSHNGSHFPLAYILTIATVQVSAAVAIVPREILYWNRGLPRILGVEVTFWLLFSSTALLCVLAGAPAVGIFATAAGCAVLRVLLFVFSAGRVPMKS